MSISRFSLFLSRLVAGSFQSTLGTGLHLRRFVVVFFVFLVLFFFAFFFLVFVFLVLVVLLEVFFGVLALFVFFLLLFFVFLFLVFLFLVVLLVLVFFFVVLFVFELVLGGDEIDDGFVELVEQHRALRRRRRGVVRERGRLAVGALGRQRQQRAGLTGDEPAAGRERLRDLAHAGTDDEQQAERRRPRRGR